MTTARSEPIHDVLVVGAGVAGALTASRLAKSGLRVLILEAGPEGRSRLELVGSYARAAEKIPSAPYIDPIADSHAPSPLVTGTDGHYEQEGPDRFKSTYQRLAGGSTWHWLGNTPRFVPNDFRLRSKYGVGVDWPLDYKDLEPWYAEAESELGISGSAEEWEGLHGSWRSGEFPMPPIWSAYGDKVVADRIDGKTFKGRKVQVRRTPQARNSTPYQDRPPCAGNTSCVPICPIGAKYDATVHLRMATDPNQRTPAELRARAVAKRFRADGEGRITGVEYDRWSPDGKSRIAEVVQARYYVLAAHAIESPLLLLASGLCKSGPVGNYLMDHLQGYGGAILREPVYPFRGPPVTSGIDEFRDGDFRSDHAAFRMSIGNDGWGRMEPTEETVRRYVMEDGLLGAPLRRAVRDRITRMIRFSYSTEMLPESSNRVELGTPDERGNPRAKLFFRAPDYNLQSFQFAKEVLEQVFHELGAVDSEFSFPFKKYSGAGHIMGTARMGPTARDSVVDRDCRAHEHKNLFVIGASAFPTSGTANPTLTVAALALRSAQRLAEIATESN